MAAVGVAVAEEAVPCSASELVDDSELSEDMVTTILARVPLPGLMRARTACRAWNRAVSAPAVHVLCKRLQWRAGSRERMLFQVVEQPPDRGFMSCVYDQASNRWYKLQVPEWLTARSLPLNYTYPHSYQTLHLPVMSTGGGILLSTATEQLRVRKRKPITTVHVGNPVANSWASLPAFPGKMKDMWDVKGMLVDPIARCFKLVVARYRDQQVTSEKKKINTYVFDSAVGTWSKTPTCTVQLPEDETHPFPFFAGVFVGSVLYCITWLDNLLAYNLEEARWRLLDVSRPRQGPLESPQFQLGKGLVNLRGRLLCLAVGRDWQNVVQVWELDLAARTWTVVAAMAPPIISHVFSRNESPWGWMGGDIWAVAGDDEVYVKYEYGDHIVALDLQTSPPAWRRLPTSPYSTSTSRPYAKRSLQCLDPWLDFGSWIRPSNS